MKKAILAILVLTSFTFLNAQTLKDEVELFQDIWGKEKKAMEANALDLNEKELALFSPIFEEYIKTRKEIGMERMQLIKKYLENEMNIDNALADQLAKGFLKNNAKLEQLHNTYYGKFSKALGAIKAAQWLQIESFIDATVRAEVQRNLPFINKGFNK